jgi:hypothetical protein
MKTCVMSLKKVLEAIEETESKLKKQEPILDERLLNHLDNLQQLAIELTLKKGGK